MSRLPLVLAVLVLTALPRVLVAEKFFREDRPVAPADKLFREALPKPAAEAPLTPELKTAIEIVVRAMVYPMADVDKKVQNNPRLMSLQVENCENRIRNIFLGMDVKNTPVQDEFLQRMTIELTKLLISDSDQYPITRVNAARVAARLASLSQREEATDLLVKILTPPKKDEPDPKQVEGAKYYALQGLKDLQSKLATKQTPPIKDAKRRAEVIDVLVGFVERQPPYKPNTEDEIEGLRFIRREAIRALAEVREARVAGVANGHAALALARVVGKDKLLTPEPRIDEEVEAAIGLCRIPVDPQKEYQPGYAAYLLAGCIKDFARKFQDARFIKEPWKVHGARLRDALKAMNEANASDPVVKTVFGFADKVLEDVEKGNNRTINPKPLTEWFEGNQPLQKTIYKSEANSSVTLRGVVPEKGM